METQPQPKLKEEKTNALGSVRQTMRLFRGCLLQCDNK